MTGVQDRKEAYRVKEGVQEADFVHMWALQNIHSKCWVCDNNHLYASRHRSECFIHGGLAHALAVCR